MLIFLIILFSFCMTGFGILWIIDGENVDLIFFTFNAVALVSTSILILVPPYYEKFEFNSTNNKSPVEYTCETTILPEEITIRCPREE